MWPLLLLLLVSLPQWGFIIFMTLSIRYFMEALELTFTLQSLLFSKFPFHASSHFTDWRRRSVIVIVSVSIWRLFCCWTIPFLGNAFRNHLFELLAFQVFVPQICFKSVKFISSDCVNMRLGLVVFIVRFVAVVVHAVDVQVVGQTPKCNESIQFE